MVARPPARSALLPARALLSGLSALLLAGCPQDTKPEDSGWAWDLPPGFPEPPVPEDNPMSAAKVELGRYLFYDTRLSGNQTQSCGSCHRQELAFTDGLAHAEGSTGEIHRRSAMGLTNIAYASGLTWASDAVRLLEDQALLPMFGEDPVELGLAGMEEELLGRLRDDAEMAARFEAAFPGEADPVSLSGITRAIAAFERTLISGGSPYDRFWYQDQPDALSAEARRGMALFNSEDLECFHCHGGVMFSDATAYADSAFVELPFHNTGLYNEDGAGAYPESDQGLIELTGDPADMGRFRAPSLRNVARTAPYMHDGSVATLDEVLDHYAAGGRAQSPLRSEFVKGFELSAEDRADLLAFLDSLTDEGFLSDPAISDPYAP